MPLELPHIEPVLFRRSKRRLGVEHAVMAHNALEPVRMPQHPVRHVPAVAGPERALPVFVDEAVVLLRIIQPQHQVAERLPAPVPIHAIHHSLPIAGRPARIDHDHHVAIGRKQLCIPAVRPRIAPGPLRSAMNQELHRIFLGSIEPRRPNDEALQLGRVLSREPEGLHLGQIELGKKGVVEVRDRGLCSREAFPDAPTGSHTDKRIGKTIDLWRPTHSHSCGDGIDRQDAGRPIVTAVQIVVRRQKPEIGKFTWKRIHLAMEGEMTADPRFKHRCCSVLS